MISNLKKYTHASFVEAALEKASASIANHQIFAPTSSEESIIAFIEGGLVFWTKGKRGIVVTTHGLYGRYGEGNYPYHIVYKDIVKQEMHLRGALKDKIYLSKDSDSSHVDLNLIQNIPKNRTTAEFIEAVHFQWFSFIYSAANAWSKANSLEQKVKKEKTTSSQLSRKQTSENIDIIELRNQISTSATKKPKKGDLVCSFCGYIVGVGKPPKHSFMGALICPICQGKSFYKAE